MYNATTVADYILFQYNKMDVGISNLKLQKILYFVQALSFIEKNEEMFSDSFQAWNFGPVIESIFEKYKRFGAFDIPDIPVKSPKIQEDDKNLIDTVLKRFQDLSNAYLTKIVQGQEPWKSNYKEGLKVKIPNEEIQKYFV